MDYFIFKDKDSREIKELIVNSLPTITKAPKRTEVIEIEGRDGDIVEDYGYQAYDKTLKITLIEDYDVNKLINWLDGKGKLILSNEPNKYYEAEIIEQIDFDRLFKYEPIEVVFHCQPYKYLLNEEVKVIEMTQTEQGEEITVEDSAGVNGKLSVRGKTIQEGEPSPDNIVTIRNVGDNINLFDKEATLGKYYYNSSGVKISTTVWELYEFKPKPNTDYTIKTINKYSVNVYIVGFDSGGNVSLITNFSSNKITFNSSNYVKIAYSVHNEDLDNCKLEEGTIATSYTNLGCGSIALKITNEDSSEEQNIVFPLSEGQLLHKGDYLAEDGIHQNKKTIVLDGTETYAISSENTNYYSFTLRDYTDITNINNKTNILCNILKANTNDDTNTIRISVNGRIVLNFSKDFVEYNSTSLQNKIKELYNSGIPVIIEIPLAEEIVVPYTEEQEEAYYQLQHLLMYEGYTNITCIDEIKPDIILNYLSKEGATIENQGLVQAKPILKIFGNGKGSIYLNNIQLFDIEIYDEYVIVDSKEEEAYKDTILKNRFMNGLFPLLEPGENQITWSGDIEKIEVLPNSSWL